MCFHGTHKHVDIIANQNNKRVVVDACIAEEIQTLNDQGIITLGSCCGHGLAGQITEWENAFGKWKGHHQPPHVLLNVVSVEIAKSLGYVPFPYYYADGEHNDVWQMILKTGCITLSDCENWHKTQNHIEYKCGHFKLKPELVHPGHDIEHKLKWFKENRVCVDCFI